MKRIRLTESQLHKLIEQALNELSPQTRSHRVAESVKKKLNESYKDNKALFDSGAGLMLAQKTAEACNMSVDDAKYEVDCIIDNLSCDAKKGNLQYGYIADELAGLGLDMEDENIEAVNQLIQAYQRPNWDDDDDDEWDVDEYCFEDPEESISRRVVENVVGKLNEMALRVLLKVPYGQSIEELYDFIMEHCDDDTSYLVNDGDCIVFGKGEIKVSAEDYNDYISDCMGEEDEQNKVHYGSTDYVYPHDNKEVYDFLCWAVWTYNDGLTVQGI